MPGETWVSPEPGITFLTEPAMSHIPAAAQTQVAA
jgi:hypothetical protein